MIFLKKETEGLQVQVPKCNQGTESGDKTISQGNGHMHLAFLKEYFL